MAWANPQFSRSQVDTAGETLVGHNVSSEAFEIALTVINNWRSSHSFPLNTFQVGLRQKAKQVDRGYLIAQRIKRLSSIDLKLRRFKSMKLSQIQDIGGCRAIVQTVPKVDELVSIYRDSSFKHKLDHVDNYIKNPRSSGYRGVHLIYRYYSDRKETYNGLKIEVQLRSNLQHVWATAVETVGTFIRQALKSSQGEKEWLRFFELMGTAIAFGERTAPVPNTPTNRKELVAELRTYATRLDVSRRLRVYGKALETIESPDLRNAHYFLLHVDPNAGKVFITGFRGNELLVATDRYLAVERQIKDTPGAEAVLVSVESLASLRRAYPNYFLDTSFFILLVATALKGEWDAMLTHDT